MFIITSTNFGLFDVAKGGEKNEYFRNQEHNLNLSMNSKRKGETEMSER